MKVVRFQSLQFVAASHENPKDPGVLKKILAKKDDLVDGRIQMINWAKIPVGKVFQKHHHEDMQEVFIVVSGIAHITAGEMQAELKPGDSVVISAGEKHEMKNNGEEPVEYVVVGIATGENGKTVVAQ